MKSITNESLITRCVKELHTIQVMILRGLIMDQCDKLSDPVVARTEFDRMGYGFVVRFDQFVSTIADIKAIINSEDKG